MGGLALTAGATAAAVAVDRDHARSRDDAAVSQAAGALRTQLAALDAQVHDVAGFFAASREVEPDEFAAFTRPMLRRSHAGAILWLEDVPAARRVALERRLGRPIRGVDGRPAARRARHVVVIYAVTARRAPSSPLGLDALSEPRSRRAVLHAERTASAAVAVVDRRSTGAVGVTLYAPVAGRPGRADGVVAAFYPAGDLAAVLRRGLDPGIAARVEIDGVALLRVGRVGADAHVQRLDYGGQTIVVRASGAAHGGLGATPAALAGGVLLTLLAALVAAEIGTRRRLRVGESRFSDAFESAPIGEALIDAEGRVGRVNRALCGLTGHEPEALTGRRASLLVDPADRDAADTLLERALAGRGAVPPAELRLRTASGATRWTAVHLTRLAADEAAHPLLAQVVDVTERHALETELRHQAEHDAVTELLNRRGFRRRLEAHLAAVGPHGAVMVIDLDHFKAVNDTLGHRVGDQVIDATGRALRACVRAEDVVARIGGDEFAVLLPGADRDRAQATADRLVVAIGAEAQLASMAGGHGVSASIGVAMLDASMRTPEEALMAADLAMYDAKDAGRRQAAFYDGRSTTGMQTRLRWVERIRSALAHDRLLLVAQPIRELASGRVVHHELLLRLRGDDGEIVAPGAFLPIAEQFGLIEAIDRWVATTAIRTLAAHRDRELVFEVNLSGSSVGSPELLAAIRDELRAGAVDPRRIVFEITETAAVTNVESAVAFARELAALGCRFALDDFGVGFGSFAYLKRLPFDFLKIDGEFVRHSATSDSDRVILESLVHAARGLGKRTIAEYVEDADTERLLAELGVDLVQGYHVGRPADLAATVAAAPLRG